MLGLNVSKIADSSKKLMNLGGGMDCVTAFHAGVAGSSPTGKEQKFVPFSFIHNPPYLYL